MEKTNKLSNKKKAQIEIIGLAVIVVLISLGIYLFFVLSSHVRPIDISQKMSDKLALTYMLTLLDTQISCTGGPTSMQELIVDCYANKLIYCEGRSSCAELNNSIETTLNRTLKIWGYKYELKIEKPDYVYSYKCNSSTPKGMTAFHPIPITVTGETTKIELSICD